MDHSFLAISLLALATVLIVAEIFIPSGGVLALGMFASLFASFYYAWLAWWETSPTVFFLFCTFAVIFLPGVAILALSWLPKTKFGKRILLQGPNEEEVIPFTDQEERLNSYVGQIAKTISPLNPGGMVSIDRERIHAFSEGGIIESGIDVEIVKVSGTRVMVRKALQISTSAKQPEPESATTPLEDDLNKTSTKKSLDIDLDISDSE